MELVFSFLVFLVKIDMKYTRYQEENKKEACDRYIKWWIGHTAYTGCA